MPKCPSAQFRIVSEKLPRPNLFFLIVFLVLSMGDVQILSAQDSFKKAIGVSKVAPTQYAIKSVHRQIEKSYYLVDNAEDLSQLDMASMIEQEFRKVVERYYISEDRMVTRIRFDGFENAFEIGTRPALMVIDTGGVEMYDKQGNVLVSKRSNPELKMETIELDNLYTSLAPPSAEEVDKLEKEGAVVTDYGAGKLEINLDGDRYYYKGDKMIVENFFYSDEDDLEGKQWVLYENLPEGKSVMSRQKSIRYVTLPSGACAELVMDVTIDGYQFDDKRVKTRSAKDLKNIDNERFVISPNPIDDFIFIDYARTFDDSENLDFSIYTIEGCLLKQTKALNTGSLEIPVSDLKEGVYLMKVKDDSGKIVVKKFVKL